MKKLAFIAIIFAAVTFYEYGSKPAPDVDISATQTGSSDSALSQAFDQHISGIEVDGEGTVSRVLPDDNTGSRHQRFIVRLDSGQTVLIAHNIDLAPKVSPLDEGDTVIFRGEYEWNEKGGVVHWTHHDPDDRHLPGWIKHAGQVSQ